MTRGENKRTKIIKLLIAEQTADSCNAHITLRSIDTLPVPHEMARIKKQRNAVVIVVIIVIVAISIVIAMFLDLLIAVVLATMVICIVIVLSYYGPRQG